MSNADSTCTSSCFSAGVKQLQQDLQGFASLALERRGISLAVLAHGCAETGTVSTTAEVHSQALQFLLPWDHVVTG